MSNDQILPVPAALAACRRWIVTYSLDTNWLFQAQPGVRAQARDSRLRDGADALVANVDYLQRWLDHDADHPGVAPNWTNEQWAHYHAQERIVSTIHPAFRLEVAQMVKDGALSLDQVRDYVLTGTLLPRQQRRRVRRSRGGGESRLVA